MSASPNPRILITRLSHIGDCVLTLPLLCALRHGFPQAHIAWAVESPSHQLLEGHRALDEVIRIPRGWLKSPRTIATLRARLREQPFDFVIDPQSLTKSSGLAWLTGSRRRIGFSRPWGRELALLLNSERIKAREQHLALRSLELLRGFGIRRPEVEFDLPVDEAARESMDHFLRQADLDRGFALINPGATWKSKQWDMERFGQVAEVLGRERRLPTLVLWAGEAERCQANLVASRSAGQAIIAPKTSLRELTALAARCRIFISGDTGPLHIAAATGAACVGLYGATRPEKCGAFGENCINLQAAYQEGSAKQRRRADNKAMLAITTEMVCEAIDRLQFNDQIAGAA